MYARWHQDELKEIKESGMMIAGYTQATPGLGLGLGLGVEVGLGLGVGLGLWLGLGLGLGVGLGLWLGLGGFTQPRQGRTPLGLRRPGPSSARAQKPAVCV